MLERWRGERGKRASGQAGKRASGQADKRGGGIVSPMQSITHPCAPLSFCRLTVCPQLLRNHHSIKKTLNSNPNKTIFPMATPVSAPASGRPQTKRQKRAEYLAAQETKSSAALPQKKFYRQRAHANPFSDHQLS
jgi:hypothetical protein